MRDLKIKQQNESNLPLLGIITHVTELTRYNYIYIHHLLKEGDVLKIERDLQRTWDNSAFAVYFKGYKLGYLSNSIKKIINKHLELQQDIEIVVKQGCFRPKKGHMSLDVVIKIN